jgi:hypothetical protein
MFFCDKRQLHGGHSEDDSLCPSCYAKDAIAGTVAERSPVSADPSVGDPPVRGQEKA